MPLPLDWPVYVSHIEASCFHALVRLPAADRSGMASCSSRARRRRKPSATTLILSHGIPRQWLRVIGELFQLAGNGWEWTSVPFEGFPGFKPFPHYPGYSADFFDGFHFVLKGASPVTPRRWCARVFATGFRINIAMPTPRSAARVRPEKAFAAMVRAGLRARQKATSARLFL